MLKERRLSLSRFTSFERMKSKYMWGTAVRKAKEACFAYEQAKAQAGQLKFKRFLNINYSYYRHFTGTNGHPSFIRIEV